MGESIYIHKSQNVSVLIYHLVCAVKCRLAVVDEAMEQVLREVCAEIELRYEIRFLEIGTDRDHVHFLIQSVPMYSAKQIVQTVKSLTAREIFARMPQVKTVLWGGEFWGKGYFINTVGQHGNEKTVAESVRKQGSQANYKALHKAQLMFDF